MVAETVKDTAEYLRELQTGGTDPVHNFLLILPMFFNTFIIINLFIAFNITKLWKKFLIEFVIVVVMVVLIVTVLERYYLEVNGILAVITVIIIVCKLPSRWRTEPFIKIQTRRPEFLSVARSTTNLITAVCILAVDFKVFPRKLGKTDVYGFGLMDVGVGLFVYSNAIVAPEINYKHDRLNYKGFKKIIISSSPLIILGVLRYFVLKQMNYGVHETEYGHHWNFFLTLAATRIFGSILLGILPNISYAKYLAVLIIGIHELILENGLSEYVFDTTKDRTKSFLLANREGIVSITGYVAIYLASVSIGYSFKFNDEVSRPKEHLKKSLKMGFVSIAFWILTYVCDYQHGVSRRIANLGYFCWILSIGATMTVLFCLLEIYSYFIKYDQLTSLEDQKDTIVDLNRNTVMENESSSSYVPVILNAINLNGLFFFLLANILTGFVNMAFNTMMVKKVLSVVILNIYMFILCVFLAILYARNIKLKYW